MLTTVKHKLLLEEASWSVAGYYQNFDTKIPLKGCLNISISDTKHFLTTDLFDANKGHKILTRMSCLTQFGTPEDINWRETLSSLGVFEGKVSIVDETLLVNLRSLKKNYQSFESFLKVFDGDYEVRGVLYQGQARLLIWRLELVKLELPC